MVVKGTLTAVLKCIAHLAGRAVMTSIYYISRKARKPTIRCIVGFLWLDEKIFLINTVPSVVFHSMNTLYRLLLDEISIYTRIFLKFISCHGDV